MMQLKSPAVVIAIVVLGGCATQRASLFEGMGEHRRKVSTDDALAQRYFDQGLILGYGFNHDEAARSARCCWRAQGWPRLRSSTART